MDQLSIKTRISQELVAALKNKDMQRVSILRLISAALAAREKELFSKGVEGPLSDEECLSVLQKEAKKRKESIAAFEAGGRADLAEQERKELTLLQEFLPAELSEAEIVSIIEEVIASGAADFGSVMRGVMAKVGGRADGKAVSELIKARLK